MTRWKLLTVAVLSVTTLFAATSVWLYPEFEGPPISAASEVSATPQRVAAGEYLVRAGNCISCHTAQGGAFLAGGRPIHTPYGDVYSTNLTPDVETGIGTWTSDDFWKAMHFGISKDGRRLYPAFPYPNYTLLSRADSDAIFAYLQTLEPVRKERIESTLRFPYSSQLALMVWRRLFFRPTTFTPDPSRPSSWNRGAYLVEALGHCDACHTPRGFLGATDADAPYEGGHLPRLSWEAPPLTNYDALDEDQASELAQLLSTGVSARNAISSGPMAEVVFHSLQHVRDSDIESIVTYLRTLPGHKDARSVSRSDLSSTARSLWSRGNDIYRTHCSECHGEDGEGRPYVYPALAGNRMVTSESPSNLIRIIMGGGFAPSTAKNPRPHGMPPYSHQLTEREVAAVTTYIRNAWDNRAGIVYPREIRDY